MTSDKLTRNELAWLFAQEAKSASSRLRQGVGLTEAAPPPAPEESGGVETTLARLEEALGALTNLHGQPGPRGRRGRIDLAALVWEIAPEARVQIEMGEGTSVFGDEAEIRRMLHVLIGQTSDAVGLKGAHEISIRREGDQVKVRTGLGPDASSVFETERQWLSRMATRFGGSFELEGAVQTLSLPADDGSRSEEIAALRKELAEAQAQARSGARDISSQFPSAGDPLVVLVAAARAISTELRSILSTIGRDIAPLRARGDDVGDVAASVSRQVTVASEVVADLSRLGRCPIGETPRHADLVELLREVVRDEEGRATRHDIKLEISAPATLADVVAPGGFQALVHALVEHAIEASPPGSRLDVTLEDTEQGPILAVDDRGPPLPPEARAGILSRDFEALSGGRTSRIALVSAVAIAAHYRMRFEVEEAPQGGTRVRVLPRG